MMDGTRAGMVELLQHCNGLTVEALTESLGLAAATVRRHLDVLQRDGHVEREAVRRSTGRPHYVFKLTQAAEPPDLDERLALRGYELSDPTSVQRCPLAPGDAVREEGLRVEMEPSEEWFATCTRLNGVRGEDAGALRGILGRGGGVESHRQSAHGQTAQPGREADRIDCDRVSVGVLSTDRRRYGLRQELAELSIGDDVEADVAYDRQDYTDGGDQDPALFPAARHWLFHEDLRMRD